jgi:hypothetical protein
VGPESDLAEQRGGETRLPKPIETETEKTKMYNHTDLSDEFSRNAEWRREKAIEYPNDKRNLEAAALLDRLAATTGDIEPMVVEAFAELFEDLVDAESWNDMIREVGFQRCPATASELVSAFIAERTGG